MVNIPGVLANGELAGVPPVYGVYTMIAGAVDLDPMGRS
jgi:MFS superfamily sulfate permease-like transporter